MTEADADERKRIFLTGEESRARFEKRRLEYERNLEREIAAMREAGEEPAPRHGDWHHVGIPASSVSAQWRFDGAFVELRISGFDYGPAVGHDFVGRGYPRHPARIRADALVSAILEIWSELAAPYLGTGDRWWPERMTLKIPGQTPIVFDRVDGWLRTTVDDKSLKNETHSVLIVECLRAMTDHVVGRGVVAEDLARRWREASDAVDLPRFPIDLRPGLSKEEREATEEADDETILAWHLGNAGMDDETWRLSAVDYAARSELAYRNEGPQPPSEEMDYGWRTTASPDAVAKLAEEAAGVKGVDRKRFEREALADRLSWSRAEIYRRDERRRDAFIAASEDQA